MRQLTRLISTAGVVAALCWSAFVRADEIVIGFSGPLSGLAAEYGQDVVNGIDLAVRHLNEAGGISVGGKKYTFKLERLDDRADPTQAVNNALRLRANGAIAVFNPVFGTSAAIMKVNENKGNEFLLLSFTSTPRITEMGNKLTLVTPGPFSAMARISADWALSKGWKSCAMVVTVGPYGDEWRGVFRKIWEAKGGTITVDRPANYYTEADFSSPLAAALATKPDVMLIGGPSTTTALVIEQARGMGFKGGFILIDQAKLDTIAHLLKGTELMGDLIGAAGAGISARPGQNFAPKYREAFNRAATPESSFNYTFVHALAKAIVAAGTAADPYKIRAAFPKAFPLYFTQYPMETAGLADDGRLLVYAATQTVTNGQLDTPVMYAWWPKTQKEFDDVTAASQIDKKIPIKWLRTEQ